MISTMRDDFSSMTLHHITVEDEGHVDGERQDVRARSSFRTLHLPSARSSPIRAGRTLTRASAPRGVEHAASTGVARHRRRDHRLGSLASALP